MSTEAEGNTHDGVISSPTRGEVHSPTSPGDSTASIYCQTTSASTTPSSSARKRVIDETLLPPNEAQKLLRRRAYNRECATKARKRTKQLVEMLQNEVKKQKSEMKDLQCMNEDLQTRLQLLEKQNRDLIVLKAVSERRCDEAEEAVMTMRLHRQPSLLTHHPHALGLRSDRLLRAAFLQARRQEALLLSDGVNGIVDEDGGVGAAILTADSSCLGPAI